MKKLLILTAALTVGTAAYAQDFYPEYMDCLANDRVAVTGDDGSVLYYNWGSVDCAQIAWAFEPGGGVGPDEGEVEIVVTTVTTQQPIALGETYGPVPERANFTSMGLDANGDAIGRIRSPVAQTVTIRQAGGGTQSFNVGAGDTNVNLGSPGTYTANIGGRSITKATGPQSFNAPTRSVTSSVSTTRSVGNAANPSSGAVCPTWNSRCQ